MANYKKGADFKITLDVAEDGESVNMGTSGASLIDSARVKLRVGTQVMAQWSIDALAGYRTGLVQDAAIVYRLKGIQVDKAETAEWPTGRLYADVEVDYTDVDMPDGSRTERYTLEIGKVVDY